MPSLADDKEAIRENLARYIAVADLGGPAAEEWAAFFTDDAEFRQQGADAVVGRDALVEFGRTMPATGVRHMISDHVIEVDGDEATCVATVALFIGGKFFGTGRASDELRRVDGRWRIASRSFAPDW